eukprot:m.181177 g.181177  ORF g.181177 m.181177 type:complete len:309 (+) comp53463_c0_seq1:183-1109(+)
MDSCVIKTKHEGIFLVQTTDFFYPLVDDPYIQGRIACANVLSDLYAMGVHDCDNVLMLLALSLEMQPQQRAAVIPLLMKGFHDQCTDAETVVTGGQTVFNPWTIVGGVATSVCAASQFILPELAEVGDVLVLTKPIGTQVAVNAHQWIGTQTFDRIAHLFSTEHIIRTYNMAMYSMAKLNRNGARLMHKYGAHGATDVTGFGILGHVANLAKNQKKEVSFRIDSFPVLRHMIAVDEAWSFKLMQGYSAETSGGLLVCLPAAAAQAFIDELQALDNMPAWIIGAVIEGDRTAILADDLKAFDVDIPEIY